jgi:hypothetical protein
VISPISERAEPDNLKGIEVDIFSRSNILGSGSALPVEKKLYRIFGVNMASEYRFANPIPRTSGNPDVSFICTQTCPHILTNNENPAYTRESRNGEGEPPFSIHKTEKGAIVHYAKIVDFFLSSDAITAHLLDPSSAHMVEILLLGPVFSFWLELRGIPMIHASATILDNSAVAFLSSSKGGKSCLAAAFGERGYPILTDDILPLEKRGDHFLARPGFPALRMWPDQAGHFLGGYQDLERVHPASLKLRIPIGPGGIGTFCPEEKPLKIIYLPRRSGPECDITIEPLSKKNAFFALIQNSFTAGLVELLGLQPQRMQFFSRMVRQVPVRRLTYPDGFDHLHRIVDAVLEDSARCRL